MHVSNNNSNLRHLIIVRRSRFKGKPPSGNNSCFGQSFIHINLRDGNNIWIFVGNDSNLGHFLIVTSYR